MFQDHPNLILPESSTVLWRYVELGRLLFLLEHKALWFAKLATLGDPYEGMPPRPLVDDMWRIGDDVDEAKRRSLMLIAEYNTRALVAGRNLSAVSCWHASPVESTAMWSLYARIGEGIAIRTTFERLRQSFAAVSLEVHGGMVRYIDFESYRPASPLNCLDWATLKRTCFSHEREFRAVTMAATGPMTAGVAIPVDLNVLIADVYVSPAAAGWFADLVRRICRRYGVEADVFQSELLRHPGYMQPRLPPAPPNKPLQPTSGTDRLSNSNPMSAARS
jgi:hypothetical protein